MKKIYLFIAFVVMTATASAQILEEGRKLIPHFPVVVPAMFSYTGQPFLYYNNKNWGVKNSIITIYDATFEKVHEFEIDYHEYEYESQMLNIETNEWVKIDGFTDYTYSVPDVWFIDADVNSAIDDGGEDVYPTQTLFNSDEKFEYIRLEYDDTPSVYEYDYDGDGVMDHRTIYRGNNCIGFSIVQEDGTVLQTIVIDDFEFDAMMDDEFHLYKINGNFYLTEGNIVFLIDKKTNNIKQVNTLPSMKISPSVADRDAQVTVELEDDAAEIQVLNAAGQTVKRIPVSDGQRHIVFNARGLNKGVNMVRAKGRNSVSRKFIVK